MKNRRRKLKKGAAYEVSCKINRGEIIFNNDFIITLFFNTIKRCKKKYSFSIKDFLIRENYVEFVILPRENSPLPRIMQWINSVFAKKYNKTMGISGRLWKERYSSKIIESVEEFIEVFEDIKKNSLIAKLVKWVRNYWYSGLYHYLHKIEGIIHDPKHRESFISALYKKYKYF
jgi:REP element-mobilizing transposase RayT